MKKAAHIVTFLQQMCVLFLFLFPYESLSPVQAQVCPAPAGIKNPNITTVCLGATISATFTPRDGSCTIQAQYSLDGGATWNAYTPGTPIVTTSSGNNRAQIRGRQTCTTPPCTVSGWTTLYWNVVAQPDFTLVKVATSNLPTVCAGKIVQATFTRTGGVGCKDTIQYRYDGVGNWTNYSTNPGSPYTISVGTMAGITLVEIRAWRSNCTAGAGCTNTPIKTLSWNVVSQPKRATLNTANPNLSIICRGQPVSATFNAGTGGVGCVDVFQYSYNNNGTWYNYVEGSDIPTTGVPLTVTRVDIRANRWNCTANSGCNATNWGTLKTWVVNPQPTGPTLNTKSPNVAAVCQSATYNVRATWNAGTGGYLCKDSVQYRYDGTGTWTPYTSGANLPTQGHTLIEIRGSRRNCAPGAGCTETPWNTIASWVVTTQPVAPTLNTKTPDANDVCAGIDVSATFNPGTGGVGCTDEFRYAYDGTATYYTYTPGTPISTTGHILVVIQGRRANCTAGVNCTGTSWIELARWNILPPPTAPTLNNKSPDLAEVCVGKAVWANFVPGSGGAGCSDEFEYSYDGSGSWTTYVPGTNISSTGHTKIEIRGRRAGCDPGCGETPWTILTSWDVVSQPSPPSLLAKTPNVTTVCEGQDVSATFNPGSGGTGCSDYFQYRVNGTGLWINYTPGTPISTSGRTLIEIRGQRSGCAANSGCNSTVWITLASWTVTAQPTGPSLLSKTPNLNEICDGQPVSATFTAGSGGINCSDVFEYRYDSIGAWLSYTPGDNLSTAGHTFVEIQGQRTNCDANTGCNGSGFVMLASWKIKPQPAAATVNTRTPDVATVCAGTMVSATFNAGNSGVGCTDEFRYRYNGSGSWYSYTPGTNIATAGKTMVEIEGRKINCTAGAGCTDANWTPITSWTVVPQPSSPGLNIKTPDVAVVCEGTDVSATFTAGTGGVNCTDEFEYSYDGSGSWNSYSPGTNLTTTGHTLVEIRGRRSGCDAGTGCNASAWVTLASWTVVPQPVSPTLNAKNPDLADVCSFTSVSATFNPGTGGTGCSDEYEYRYDGGAWLSYTPNTFLNTTGHTLIEIQGRRTNCTANSGCNSSAWTTLATWNILAQPSAPSLQTKTPDLNEVCEGTNVSATANAGSGGVSCRDSFRYRYDGNASWFPYTPGTPLTTTGHISVEIQAMRGNCNPLAGCISTAWQTIASWTIQKQPSFPSLQTKIPDFPSVCDGQNVSATFVPGTGGTGCTDEYQYQYDGAGGWFSYTPGNNISTSGHSSVLIQGRRSNCTAGSGCNTSSWTDLASWTITTQPTAPTLNTATPNLPEVCSGQSVSATFNPGSDGSGCIDQFRYRYNGAGTWYSYTPGTSLSTNGYTSIEIQGARTGCNPGTGCTGTAWNTLVSWVIRPQPSPPSLNTKTPDLPQVCEGTDVSATFNSGSGGTGCTDVFEYSYDNSGTWNNYVAGTPLSTTGHSLVQIRGQRTNCTAGAGCTESGWVILASWTVAPQPSVATINTKNPNLAEVCTGKMVSATFNAGTGGVGCTDVFEYSFDNSGTWLTYVPGNNLNTTGHSLVEIRSQRTNCTAGAGCTSTGWSTLASWTVQPQPSGPTLAVKTPDQASVCDGQSVSATFNAGTGGAGCTDTFAYRYDGIGTWQPYTPGSDISATGHSMIEIRGQRGNCAVSSNCVASLWTVLATWTINPQPNGPTLNMKTPNLPDVCEGTEVSATFVPGSGGVNCTDVFEYSYDNSDTWNSYTPGTPLSTTGHSLVEIRGNRSGCTAGCSGSPWVILASWNVVPQPSAPSLVSILPNAAEVCEDSTVTAVFAAGSDGVNCTDEFRYRFDESPVWSTYINGVALQTSSHTKIEIQARRGSCTAFSGCAATPWTTVATWNIIPRLVSPKLDTKTPPQDDICDSQRVSVTVTAGSGGTGCSDEFRYEFDSSGTWNTYTPGTDIDISGHHYLIIEGRRAGCTTCAETPWKKIAAWNISPVPQLPVLLARTPDTNVICAGQPVTATFQAGTGGVGCSDMFWYRFDSSGTWERYTPGTEIKTDGHSYLEIKGSRTGCSAACTNTDTITYTSWTLIPQPVYPTLASKNPDAREVCENVMLSALFNSGSGGVGSADTFRYSYDNSGTWLPYTAGQEIPAEGHTRVDIQGMRTVETDSSGCAIRSWEKYVTWYINPLPVIINTVSDSSCITTRMTLKATASSATSLILWYDSLTGGKAMDSSYNDVKFHTPVIYTTTYYYAEAKDKGCTSSSRVPVVAKIMDCDDIQKDSIPNLFSPNGDGFNDTWDFDIRYHPEAVVQIYNRWGQLVWTSDKGYTKKWDGTTRQGQKAPEDGYHYVIINEGKIIKTGGVVLIR